MPPGALVEKMIEIPISLFKTETGTWTYSSNSGALKLAKTPNTETTIVSFEIPVSRADQQFGLCLKQIAVFLKVSTANLSSAPSIAINEYNLYLATSAANNALTVTTLNTSNDSTVNSNNNPCRWTTTVVSPTFENTTGIISPASYNWVASIPCASGTVLELYGAQAILNVVE